MGDRVDEGALGRRYGSMGWEIGVWESGIAASSQRPLLVWYFGRNGCRLIHSLCSKSCDRYERTIGQIKGERHLRRGVLGTTQAYEGGGRCAERELGREVSNVDVAVPTGYCENLRGIRGKQWGPRVEKGKERGWMIAVGY